MTRIKLTVDQKIDNLQHQIDTINRSDSVFKGYVHRQFEGIAKQMATKEDLYAMEARIGVTTKSDLRNMEKRLRGDMATKADLEKMATKADLDGMATKSDFRSLEVKLASLSSVLIKIAEKVGVST